VSLRCDGDDPQEVDHRRTIRALDALEILHNGNFIKAEAVQKVVVRAAHQRGLHRKQSDMPDICLQHLVAIMLVDNGFLPCRTQ